MKKNIKLVIIVILSILVAIGVSKLVTFINFLITYYPSSDLVVPKQSIEFTYADEEYADFTKLSDCVIFYDDRKELVFQYGDKIDSDYNGDYVVIQDIDGEHWRRYDKLVYYTEVVTFRNITKPTKTDNWFSSMWSLKQINNWNLLDTSNTVTMNNMFSNLGIEYIDISNLDTHNVTEMNFMFCHCNHLKGIDFSELDLSNLRSYDGIFSKCDYLNKENVIGFYR